MSLDAYLTMSDKSYRDAQLSQSILQIRLLRERSQEKFFAHPSKLIADHALSLQRLENSLAELRLEYHSLQREFENLDSALLLKSRRILTLVEKQRSLEKKAKTSFALAVCALVFHFFFLAGFALAL